ncbi:unnamed protein product [Gongylonema pulchrum]|uniref:Uncharacterized protein n=1 Tax=Gongylonema pulchrum TaxID=637853 RepID=A0A183DM05_9BILA|nr:unnamed protein product [Gongylonema pulchrum]
MCKITHSYGEMENGRAGASRLLGYREKCYRDTVDCRDTVERTKYHSREFGIIWALKKREFRVSITVAAAAGRPQKQCSALPNETYFMVFIKNIIKASNPVRTISGKQKSLGCAHRGPH